jgi:hypothetical protein
MYCNLHCSITVFCIQQHYKSLDNAYSVTFTFPRMIICTFYCLITYHVSQFLYAITSNQYQFYGICRHQAWLLMGSVQQKNWNMKINIFICFHFWSSNTHSSQKKCRQLKYRNFNQYIIIIVLLLYLESQQN